MAAPRGGPAILSVEQASHLLRSIEHTRTCWPVLMALATGARRGEVLALRWRSVDLEHGNVRIVESLKQTSSGLMFKAPKTEKVRAIALPAFAIDANVDIVTISKRLGHASPNITLQVYAHLFQKRDDKAAAAINAAFPGRST